MAFRRGSDAKDGFTKSWIQLLMVFVKTMSYSILVNGEP